MANNTKYKRTTKPKRLNKFFWLNDKLHKVLFVNKPADVLVAFNYMDYRKVSLGYTDVQRYKEPAYSTAEAAFFVNRHWRYVWRLIHEEKIRQPYKVTNVRPDKQGWGQYVWSEKDILELHDFLLTQQTGPPRKDGYANPKNLPSKMQMQAMMRNNIITYVKDSDGEFVPIWKAQDWT